MIHEHLQQIEFTIASLGWAESKNVLRCDIVETDREEILVYRLRIELADGGLLEMIERYVNTKNVNKIETTAYRFHWQGNDGRLIRRWDNAPHFPSLAGFPDHIHCGPEDAPTPGSPVNILDILAEIDIEFSDENQE